VTVYIIGAGATRGASFVKDTTTCKPPLDGDFYTQLQRIANPKHHDLIKEVTADAVSLFGTNFRLTLETMFTTLEYTIRMVQATGETRDFKRTELQNQRNRLMQAIAATCEEALTEKHQRRSSLTPRECDHHRILIKRMRRGDTIISFNYDCLIDHALLAHGDKKWNPHYGYGFNLGSHGTKLRGDGFWTPPNPATQTTTIKLLKLHGSLHFHITEPAEHAPTVRLKQRPYTQQHGVLHFTIIPPESNKQFDHGVFQHFWKQARAALHRATTMILIGYSLPSTDLHSTALLRTSVKKNGLKSLVVVNPDAEARRRTREILHRGITENTKVLSFDTLKEFIKAPTTLWG
jgi:hypothetical protein